MQRVKSLWSSKISALSGLPLLKMHYHLFMNMSLAPGNSGLLKGTASDLNLGQSSSRFRHTVPNETTLEQSVNHLALHVFHR